MAHLIIGHTTETTARVWVRGSRWHRRCEITLDPADSAARRIRLPGANDYCGVVDFDGLTPGRRYAVTASFSLLNAGFPGLNRSVSGSVRTIQRPEDGKRLRFSFVLSSCNLSVVSINDLLALVLATGGTAVAARSLGRLPLERWRRPGLRWLRAVLRWPAEDRAVARRLVCQDDDQRRSSRARPIFAARFSSSRRSSSPRSSSCACRSRTCRPLAISSSRRAAAVSWHLRANRTDIRAMDRSRLPHLACRHDVRRRPFRAAARLPTGSAPASRIVSAVRRASCSAARRVFPGTSPPSFFLHAGDQIYYDFPWRPANRSATSIGSRTAKRGSTTRRIATCSRTGRTT